MQSLSVTSEYPLNRYATQSFSNSRPMQTQNIRQNPWLHQSPRIPGIRRANSRNSSSGWGMTRRTVGRRAINFMCSLRGNPVHQWRLKIHRTRKSQRRLHHCWVCDTTHRSALGIQLYARPSVQARNNMFSTSSLPLPTIIRNHQARPMPHAFAKLAGKGSDTAVTTRYPDWTSIAIGDGGWIPFEFKQLLCPRLFTGNTNLSWHQSQNGSQLISKGTNIERWHSWKNCSSVRLIMDLKLTVRIIWEF